jgi:hypothetical protein
MYPPLCIPAASGRKAAQAEADIRGLSQSPGFVAKFAVWKLAERMREHLLK